MSRSVRLSLRPLVLLGLALLPLQAATADDRCVRQGIADAVGLPKEKIVLAEAIEAPLYVELDSSFAPGDRFQFEVRRNGAIFSTEEVELVENRSSDASFDFAARPVVELFSTHPSRLNLLRRTIGDGTADVAISHNGKALRVETFAALERKGRTLAEGAIAPQAIRSTVRTEASARPHQKSACTDACYAELEDCNYYRCGQFGSASCYDNCYWLYLDCLEFSCNTCQPSSSSTTTFSTVSTTPTSVYQCHTSGGFFPKGIYRRYTRQIKQTVTTTTINSDCSETVTTQIFYFNIDCWVYQYSEPNCSSYGDVLPWLC